MLATAAQMVGLFVTTVIAGALTRPNKLANSIPYGINNTRGTATITNCTVSGFGTGLFSYSDSLVKAINCTLSKMASTES